MHIKSTNWREREWEALRKATGENTTAGAIDVAARYYLQMAGGTTAFPHGVIKNLMQAALDRGLLSLEEIAEIVDAQGLPVE